MKYRLARLLMAYAAWWFTLASVAGFEAGVEGGGALGLIILRTVAAAGLAQLAAIVSYPVLRAASRPRAVALTALSLAILLAPLLIPADARLARFIGAVLAVLLTLKLRDLHVGANHGKRPDPWTFLFFLPNPTIIVLRKMDAERREDRHQGKRLARSLALLAGAVASLGLFWLDWSQLPFLLEHAAKATAFFFFAISLVAVAIGTSRLARLPVRDFTNAPFLARTPADFWRRYNRGIQQFYYEDVFKLLGGRRRPGAATLLIFVISAAMHEYAFGMAIGRVQGYQTAFFLLQGCAVASTLRLKPTGWKAVCSIAATIAFNLITSILFFASVDRLLPFYSHPLPGWLSTWQAITDS